MRGKFTVTRSVSRFARNVGTAVSLLRDYWKGSYRNVPWYILTALVVTAIYVFDPLDFVPDVLPVIGLVDDALVMAFCLALVEKDLHRYAEWKESNR